MENQVPESTSPQVYPTSQPSPQSPSQWEPLVQGWQALAAKAQSLIPQAMPSQTVQTQLSNSSEAQPPEFSGEVDPVLQAWSDAGLSPAVINDILVTSPYVAGIPAIAGDYELIYQLSQDPDFQRYKDDPGYISRLSEQLAQDPVFNEALPTSMGQSDGIYFPPNFSSWSQDQAPDFYNMDRLTLGRALAEYGGDFQRPGY
jgi:hypothetical protein